ncbi:unnamed protein product, partial [Prorocentrum cordatum]
DRVPFDQIVSLVRRLQDHTAERAQTVSAALAGGCSAGAADAAAGASRADALASPCSVASVESSCVSPGASRGFDYHEVNLNKLSESEINEHKARMDVVFLANQKKPGDPGFVYDKQVDFETESQGCGWDSDEDDA